MFDKLKTALMRAAAPEPAPMVPTSHALVPVARASYEVDRPADKLGFLDRHGDSARPSMMPAPMLRSFDEEARLAHLPASAHARHLQAVSGFIAYGVELNLSWVCGGDGLKLNLTPDHEALGWTKERAKYWATEVEQRFAEWCDDASSCDASGRMKFGAMQGAALRSWLMTGDAMANLDYGPKPNAAWRTAVSLVDPIRVMTPPTGWMHGARVHVQDGIEFDDRGRAIAYHVRPPNGLGPAVRVPTYLSNGRKAYFHAFDADAGSIRGVSPLASAIGGIMQAMSAADAGVLAAHIGAMLMGTITSDLPSADVARSLGGEGGNPLAALMQSRIEWHEQLKKAGAHVRLGGDARIAHLSSGERLELHRSENFDQFDVILKHGLREAARALGLSYEHLTSDKSGATYSSLKYATVELRSIVDRRRKLIIEPLCEFALEAVVEELIAKGALPFWNRGRLSPLDAFREKKRLALKAQWVGPAIPDPDELKSAKAAIARLQYGLSSLSDEIMRDGRDPDAVFDRRAADRDALRQRNVFLPWPDNPGRPPQRTTKKED